MFMGHTPLIFYSVMTERDIPRFDATIPYGFYTNVHSTRHNGHPQPVTKPHFRDIGDLLFSMSVRLVVSCHHVVLLTTVWLMNGYHGKNPRSMSSIKGKKKIDKFLTFSIFFSFSSISCSYLLFLFSILHFFF